MQTLMLLAALTAAEPKPANIPMNTWVREDIFAGFLGGDMVRFEQGMTKVEDLLSADPKAGDVLSWKAGGQLYLAVREAEAGRMDGFEKGYAESKASFAKARELMAKSPALGTVLAVTGGSFAAFGERVPEKYRREAWTMVRDNYSELRELQKAFFDKLPLHMRGEVLAGLAQASQRLGEADAASRLTELLTALPGSVYASRAQRWQEKPEVASRTSLTCQTCHDAGRLDAVKARTK